ncbi:MAG: hypothetical protein D6805_00270, partial [Planctomycetota bacterium]
MEKAQFIYHSNTLSHITLSLQQTVDVLEGKINPLEEEELLSPTGDTFETSVITSHLNALNYILRFPIHKKIDEAVIQEIHKRLMEGLILSNGEYRQCPPELSIPQIPQLPFPKIP